MKLQRLSTCIGLIATSAIALSAESVRAFEFTALGGAGLGSCADLVDEVDIPLFKAFVDETFLSECTTDDGFTLSVEQPSGASLQGKLVDKDGFYKGVGITTGSSPFGDSPIPGEIEAGEILKAELDEPSKIDSFDLSFLYFPRVFGDDVFEVAEITTDGGLIGTLTVTGENSAEWVFDPGGLNIMIDAINLDPSAEVEGGAYRVRNPFGDLEISSLLFTAPDVDGIDEPRDSDYALVALRKDEGPRNGIPEPATLLGLGVVGGLMAASRRKKSSR